MLFQNGKQERLDRTFLETETERLDRKVAKEGFAKLSTPERYLFARGLADLPIETLDELGSMTPMVKKAIQRLEKTDNRTYARVSANLLAPVVADGSVYGIDRSPLEDGPAAIFVPNVGGQYPVRGGTVGNRSRRVLGIQPPIGSFYVASWLGLLGVEVKAFNLELGDSEFEACDAALDQLGERCYFLFSTSNFFTQTEIESMYFLNEQCRRHEDRGYVPRLVGAGYSSYFNRREYLDYTPLDIVVGPHGETSEADMIFSSGYEGPRDTRPALELFSDIPNLHLADRTGDAVQVHDTRVVKLTEFERRVFSGGLDVNLMELDTKYWTPTNIMDVCAPDDLNIPLELAELPQIDEESGTDEAGRETGARARATLSLSNYVHRPNAIKMMTVFGSCPRACEFCQLTQWGEQLYFYDGSEAVRAMNRAASAYPDLQMYIFEDDDFLLRRSHVDSLISALRDNEPTQGKTIYVSTVPMEVDPDIMLDLRDVGFRAMLLGLETPVERVARQIGKFKARYNWDHILEAPKIGHDAGLHMRITAIPFYPLVQEDDLAGVLNGLLDFITYKTGISVAVHPLVKAAPGIEITKHGAHEVTTKPYVLPDGSERSIDLLQYVMPDDPIVKAVALEAIKTTADRVDSIVEALGTNGGDHPSALGVVALFASTVEAWRRTPGRNVDDEVLDALDARLKAAIDQITFKHRAMTDVQGALKGQGLNPASVSDYLTAENAPYLHLGLRMAADFGTPEEAVAAARIATFAQAEGFTDWTVQHSLGYALKRKMPLDVQRELTTLVEGLGEPVRPVIKQHAPKLLRLAQA
ncbi:radical SAM protein [Streptomyces sp. BE230]|uniref:radical SAM protein n=1 Tax=Streptomyces sp. BE230 TaxID=3002526 RepID=UPI002ED65D53|nr:radical SAM protein [Streptomyces sp. BE230]